MTPGDYKFAVGTAGSTTLVLQTILPALMTADGASRVVIEGGTHNPAAPPFDFLARVFLPLVARMGPRVEAVLERPGFYPAGGGRIVVTIEPPAMRTLAPLVLDTRGDTIDASRRRPRRESRSAHRPSRAAGGARAARVGGRHRRSSRSG